jgi:hypothetical protein
MAGLRWAIAVATTLVGGLGVLSGCHGGDGEAGRTARHESPGRVMARAAEPPPGPRRLKGDEDDDDPRIGYERNREADNDADADNDRTENAGKGYYDDDDASVSNFGHPADRREARRLAKLAARYRQAESAADGELACKMLRAGMARRVVQTYGSALGPAYLRGAQSCNILVARLFRHTRRRRQLPSMRVVGVRLADTRALVLLGSTTSPAAYFTLVREQGAWRFTELTAATLP